MSLPLILFASFVFNPGPRLDSITKVNVSAGAIYGNAFSKSVTLVEDGKTRWRLAEVNERGKVVSRRKVGDYVLPAGTDSSGSVVFQTTANHIALKPDGQLEAMDAYRIAPLVKVQGEVLFPAYGESAVRIRVGDVKPLRADLKVMCALIPSVSVLCRDKMANYLVVNLKTGIETAVPAIRSGPSLDFGLSSYCASLDEHRVVGYIGAESWNPSELSGLPNIGKGIPYDVFSIVDLRTGKWTPLAVFNVPESLNGGDSFNMEMWPQVAVFKKKYVAFRWQSVFVAELKD